MLDQLQKAFDLVKKTGDKLVVFDSAKPENVFVVLTLKDYENLVLCKSEVRDLTEDGLLDKINRDIAIWKSEQVNDKDLEANLSYFSQLPERDEREENQAMRQKNNRKPRGWSIPSRRKQGAEEIIDEDQQYLEDIVF
jgi:hypothetical protein